MSSSINKITRVQLRRDTSLNWAAVADEVVLHSGEFAVDTDARKFKIGDGQSVWSQLDFYGDSFLDVDLEDIQVNLQPDQGKDPGIPAKDINIGIPTNRFNDIFIKGKIHLGDENGYKTNPARPTDVYLETDPDGRHIDVWYYDYRDDANGILTSYKLPTSTGDLPLANALGTTRGGSSLPDLLKKDEGEEVVNFALPPVTDGFENQTDFNRWAVTSFDHLDKVKVEQYDFTTDFVTPNWGDPGDPQPAREPKDGELFINTGTGDVFTIYLQGLASVSSNIPAGTTCKPGDILWFAPPSYTYPGWNIFPTGGGGGAGTLTGISALNNEGLKVDSSNPAAPSIGIDFTNLPAYEDIVTP